MADTIKKIEREYTIPLRRELSKVARYERSNRAVKAIKKFIAKHMKVPDRNVSNVKIDSYLNNEIWFRGNKKPPTKIKVKATRDGDIVRVELSETPDEHKFAKLRHEKFHKPSEQPKAPAKTEEKKEEKTEEEKKEEEEKGKAVEEQHIKQAEQAARTQKHTIKGKAPQIQRKALKK